jgi:hypothetical protein
MGGGLHLSTRFAAGVLILLCALFGAADALAQAGVLEYVVGNVSVQSGGGEPRRADKGAPVANGDTVITDAGAYTNIRFADGAQVFLRPNARVLIEAYVYEKDRAERDSFVYRLLKGSLRAITGQIGSRGKPEAYRLNTVIATIGIRGTTLDAEICADDCPGKSNGQRTDAVVDPHHVSNPAGRADVNRGDGSYTKDAQTPPEEVKGGNGLAKNDPPRTPDREPTLEELEKSNKEGDKAFKENVAKHTAENAAYEQKVDSYLEKYPPKDAKPRRGPAFIYDENGKLVKAVQYFYNSHLTLSQIITFDANGNTQGYILTAAGRLEQWLDARLDKLGTDGRSNRWVHEGKDANGDPTIREIIIERDGVWLAHVWANDKGEPYRYILKDEDGNVLENRDDPSRYPPLQQAYVRRIVTGVCDHPECRRRADARNAIATKMNARMAQLNELAANIKFVPVKDQAAERLRHEALFKEWESWIPEFNQWDRATQDCEQLCRKDKGLVAQLRPVTLATCSVTTKALEEMAAINKAAGGTLGTVTRLPPEAGGGFEGEIKVPVPDDPKAAANACAALGGGNVTVVEKVPCGQMAQPKPGSRPTGPRARSVGRNPVEMQVEQGKSFAQPVVIDRAANADGNIVNFLDGTTRPWRPQDSRGPSVQTPAGGRFQIPASACPAGGGTLPLSQRVTLGSFKTVDYDRVQSGVEYGQNAFDLLTRLEYLKYKQENGLPVEEADIKGLVSEINGLRGGKFEKLGTVLDGISKGFERKEKIEGLINKTGEIIEFLDTAQRGRDDPVQAAQALSMYLNLVGGIAGKVPGMGEFVSMYAKGVENMVQDLRSIQKQHALTVETIRTINDFTEDMTGESVPAENAPTGPQSAEPPAKVDADAVNRYNGTRAESNRLSDASKTLNNTENCIDRCRARIEAAQRTIDDLRTRRERLGDEKSLETRITEMIRNRVYYENFRKQNGADAVPSNQADYNRFARGREATDPRVAEARSQLSDLKSIEPRIQKALADIAQLQKQLEDCNKRLAGEQRAYLQAMRAFVEKDEFLRLLGAKVPADQAQQQAKALAEQIPLEPPAPGSAVSSNNSCGTVSVVQVCQETSFSVPRNPGPPVAATAGKGESAAEWARRTQPPPIDFDKFNEVTEDPAEREREMRAIEQLGAR